MRSEKEMLDLIINTAVDDPRIRAAYLEGSRPDPNVSKDIFQDYDVVYVVAETQSFRDDNDWINRFGDRLYMQYPEDNVYYPSDVDNCYGWLMQFADGNRLDLHVCTWNHVRSNLNLYRTLVDKDNLMPEKQMLSDKKFWVRKPTQEQFHCTCNEFWWCLNNIAKGLWREEIPYVMDMMDFQLRPMLRRMLEWMIGIENDFSVSVGKSAKYMSKYVSDELYKEYLETYSVAQIAAIWNAAFAMCELFEQIAAQVSEKLDFSYDSMEADHSRAYLQHISELSHDADVIY
ncbi:aminoglycoside 6-adenylyltransferase [Oscillospiraceae bacterium HV4-5-C5C]|nr:aminoglycoside 6-adenylyltransferase [Oscillospiraceae bacterium HV4-5-C5C]